MSNIATILARKGSSYVTMEPEQTVLEALQLMADKNVGAVVVKDAENYHGIFTERDYSRNVILKNRHSSETKVKEVMSVNLPELHALDSLNHCMQLMADHNVRYLPVMEEGKMAGIISITDVIREKVIYQKEVIKHLKEYIQG
ncbi:MAG: CBS domain-containing protein [Kaistella sp.]